MNNLTHDPDAALVVARRTIADRVDRAAVRTRTGGPRRRAARRLGLRRLPG